MRRCRRRVPDVSSTSCRPTRSTARTGPTTLQLRSLVSSSRTVGPGWTVSATMPSAVGAIPTTIAGPPRTSASSGVPRSAIGRSPELGVNGSIPGRRFAAISGRGVAPRDVPATPPRHCPDPGEWVVGGELLPSDRRPWSREVGRGWRGERDWARRGVRGHDRTRRCRRRCRRDGRWRRARGHDRTGRPVPGCRAADQQQRDRDTGDGSGTPGHVISLGRSATPRSAKDRTPVGTPESGECYGDQGRLVLVGPSRRPLSHSAA